MIELAQHIETLLLENDCVIVPGLGGFVAHYAPATRVKEENIFLPPTRIIGFNPQLKMNDGLLVQSYMSVYGTNFSDATKMVERKVNELISVLHEEGKVDLPNVGEVRYTIHNTFDFAPYDNKITTPYLYGLDAFEMKELSALGKPQAEKAVSYSMPTVVKEEKRTFAIKINRAYLTNAAAIVAAIVEKQSLAITPIVVKQNTPTRKSATDKQAGTKKVVAPVAVREVKVGKTPAVASETKVKEEASHSATTTEAPKQNVQPATAKPVIATPKRPYHIIIASVGTEQDAETMAAQLISKGFKGAKAIVGDGKMRVSIESCGTEVEAYQALARIRQDETYKNAWVLKK